MGIELASTVFLRRCRCACHRPSYVGLRLFWKALGVLPTAFGSYVDYLISSPPVSPTPVPMGHMLMELPSFDPTLHGSVAAPPALTGHCSPEPESLWEDDSYVAYRWRGWSRCGFCGGDARFVCRSGSIESQPSLSARSRLLHSAALGGFCLWGSRALGEIDARVALRTNQQQTRLSSCTYTCSKF